MSVLFLIPLPSLYILLLGKILPLLKAVDSDPSTSIGLGPSNRLTVNSTTLACSCGSTTNSLFGLKARSPAPKRTPAPKRPAPKPAPSKAAVAPSAASYSV